MRLEIDLTDDEAKYFDHALQGMISQAGIADELDPTGELGYVEIGEIVVRVAKRIRAALGGQDLTTEEMASAIVVTDALAATRHNKRKGDS